MLVHARHATPSRLSPLRLQAYAVNANFKGADMTNAVVDRVDFDGADLSYVNFTNAVITGASFTGAGRGGPQASCCPCRRQGRVGRGLCGARACPVACAGGGLKGVPGRL
jgi:hypothetical protein